MTRLASAASRARRAMSRLAATSMRPIGLVVLLSLGSAFAGIFGEWPSLQLLSLVLLSVVVLHTYGGVVSARNQLARDSKPRDKGPAEAQQTSSV